MHLKMTFLALKKKPVQKKKVVFLGVSLTQAPKINLRHGIFNGFVLALSGTIISLHIGKLSCVRGEKTDALCKRCNLQCKLYFTRSSANTLIHPSTGHPRIFLGITITNQPNVTYSRE